MGAFTHHETVSGDQSREKKVSASSSKRFDVFDSNRRHRMEQDTGKETMIISGRVQEIEQQNTLLREKIQNGEITSQNYFNLFKEYHAEMHAISNSYADPYEARKHIDAMAQDYGIDPDTSILTKDGFGKQRKVELSLAEKQHLEKMLSLHPEDILLQYKKLKNRNEGKSFKNIIKKGDRESIKELTDISLYYMQKAVNFSSDEEKFNTWKRINDTYNDKADYRESTKLFCTLQRYTEAQLAKDKVKATYGMITRGAMKAYYFLPMSKVRAYKKYIAVEFGLIEERKRRLEKKYSDSQPRSKKNAQSQVNFEFEAWHEKSKLELDQTIKLKGKRGREQGALAKILNDKEKYDYAIASGELETHKITLARDLAVHNIEKKLNELSRKPAFHTQEGRLRITLASECLTRFKISDDGINKIISMVHESKLQNEQKLTNMLEIIQKDIRKYGSPEWRATLNDIASDCGFVVGVVGTLVSWKGLVPLAACGG